MSGRASDAQKFENPSLTRPVLLWTVYPSPNAARADKSDGGGPALRLPCNPDGLFAWCLAQDADTLRSLLAFCVARTVNAVLMKADHADSPRMRHASMLADAIGLDMTAWFTPTAANYFGKVSKSAIIEAPRSARRRDRSSLCRPNPEPCDPPFTANARRRCSVVGGVKLDADIGPAGLLRGDAGRA
jgi:hypothetical protein